MEKTIMIVGSAIATVMIGAILYQLFVGDIMGALMPTLCRMVDRINSALPTNPMGGWKISFPGCKNV